jgi:hypothetical protein
MAVWTVGALTAAEGIDHVVLFMTLATALLSGSFGQLGAVSVVLVVARLAAYLPVPAAVRASLPPRAPVVRPLGCPAR